MRHHQFENVIELSSYEKKINLRQSVLGNRGRSERENNRKKKEENNREKK